MVGWILIIGLLMAVVLYTDILIRWYTVSAIYFLGVFLIITFLAALEDSDSIWARSLPQLPAEIPSRRVSLRVLTLTGVFILVVLAGVAHFLYHHSETLRFAEIRNPSMTFVIVAGMLILLVGLAHYWRFGFTKCVRHFALAAAASMLMYILPLLTIMVLYPVLRFVDRMPALIKTLLR